MTIFENVEKNLLNARKSKHFAATNFYGMVLARIKVLTKANPPKELTDENVLQEIKKIIKESKETLEIAQNGNRTDLVNKTQNEIDMLVKLIPADMQEISKEELSVAIDEILLKISAEQKGKAMGIVMKQLKEKFGNRFDGKTANILVKDKLK